MGMMFGGLCSLKTNRRVDRIFRIVGYGTILVLLCIADVVFEPPANGAASGHGYLSGKLFITTSLVGIFAFLLLRSLQPRGALLIQSLSPYSGRLVHGVTMVTSICFLLLIGVAYSGDLLRAGPMVGVIFLSLPVWLPLLLIVTFLSSGRLQRGLALAIVMYCTLVFVSITILSISRDWECPWWIRLVLSIAALGSLVMTGMTAWTYYTLPPESHDPHKLLGEFSALRSTIIIATGIYLFDSFVLNQGALALVLFLVVLFYFAPAIMWAFCTHGRLGSLRFYKAVIYVMAAAAILFTNALQNRIADAKAVKLGDACVAYRARYHHYPKELRDLVPEFISSVPPAKYTLLGGDGFYYARMDSDREPMLYYEALPPFGRRFYHLESRSWGYLD